MRWYALFSRLNGAGRERGAVAIFTALALFFVIPGFTALAVDVGRYMFERQQLQNALDAGALAGAQLLPFDGAGAETIAREFARNNDSDVDALSDAEIEVSFGCLVQAEATDPTRASRTQVISLCRQFENQEDTFSCQDNGRCYRPCEFNGLDREGCNAITVQAKIEVSLVFAPLLRFATEGEPVEKLVAALEGNACRGSCGAPPDLSAVLLIDRTRSLRPVDHTNIKNGAKAVLSSGFDPELHQIALGAIPACSTNELTRGCDPENFIKVPLSRDFGSLETTIDSEAFERDGGDTNLGTPTEQANELLTADEAARLDRDINKYIILLTDGIPNKPATGLETRCEHAFNQAAAAKQDGVRVFTIGYRLEVLGPGDTCTEPGFVGDTAAVLLQNMSSGGENSEPPLIDNCAQENEDEDDFFCETGGRELTEVFRQILREIFNDLGGSSLVDLSVYQFE